MTPQTSAQTASRRREEGKEKGKGECVADDIGAQRRHSAMLRPCDHAR